MTMYAVILLSEIEKLSEQQVFELFCMLNQDGINTLRKSLNGEKVIIKWDSNSNPCDDFDLEHDVYTYDEIINVLSTPEWWMSR